MAGRLEDKTAIVTGGSRGIAGFSERYGDSFHRWRETMGTPRLTDEVGRTLVEGIAEAERGRTFEELTAERDRKPVAVLKALE